MKACEILLLHARSAVVRRYRLFADDRWSPLRVKRGAPIGSKTNIGENSGLVVPEFYREPSPSVYKTKSMLPPNKGMEQERSHSCPILICVESFGGFGNLSQKVPKKTRTPASPKNASPRPHQKSRLDTHVKAAFLLFFCFFNSLHGTQARAWRLKWQAPQHRRRQRLPPTYR